MINFGDYSLRNIQEQVAKNATDITELDEAKQDKLTAGDGIDITNNVVSSTVNVGTQLYLHEFIWSGGAGNFAYVVGSYVSANSTPVTNYATLTSVVYGSISTGGITSRTGFAAGGSISGTFMFAFNSILVYAMIVFANDGSTEAGTIASGGAITGSWTETVTEL